MLLSKPFLLSLSHLCRLFSRLGLHRRVCVSLFVVCVSLTLSVPVQAIEIKHSKPRQGSSLDAYAIELLAFLVELSGEQAELVPFEGSSSQPRKEFQLRNGEFDVDWFGAAQTDELRVEPVRYPILRGLLGYRVFITNRKQAAKLTKQTPLTVLQALHVVQGEGWGDVAFLRKGGFHQVKTLSSFENLFKMVELERADVFPRSIIEPFSELAKRCHLNAQFECENRNLLVDPHVMVAYKFPLFFFVSPQRPDVRYLLENAFREHYDKFEQFFLAHPLVKEAMTRMQGRTLYFIDNTEALSSKTQALPARYWFTPNL